MIKISSQAVTFLEGLPGTEDMDQEYHQKWFHVKVMFPVVPIAVVVGGIVAFLMTWIW